MNRIGMVAIAVAALLTAQANGSVVTWSGSDAEGHAASAKFDTDGGGLVVTLTNTGIASSLQRDVLTILFFNFPDFTGSLTPVSGDLPATGSVVNIPAPYAGPLDVSGEWAYKTNVYGFEHVIASAGDTIVGPGDTFKPSNVWNLWGPESPDGIQAGIVSALAVDPIPSPAGSSPLLQDNVVFTFSVEGTPPDLTEMDYTDVLFLYGTGLNADPPYPEFGPVPEPASVVIWSVLGAGAAAGGLALRRRRTRVRGPWSEENRKAIFEIIEQGRA